MLGLPFIFNVFQNAGIWCGNKKVKKKYNRDQLLGVKGVLD